MSILTLNQIPNLILTLTQNLGLTLNLNGLEINWMSPYTATKIYENWASNALKIALWNKEERQVYIMFIIS